MITVFDADAREIAARGIEVERARDGRALERGGRRAGGTAGRRARRDLRLRACPDARVAAAQLAAASPRATIVNVQNGLDGDAVFAERFARVIGAVIRHNCTRVDAHFARSQRNARIIVGAYPEGCGDDAFAIAALLRGAGYDTGVSAQIAEDRWLKLCVNLMSTPNALVRPADHETRAFTEGKARTVKAGGKEESVASEIARLH